MSDDIQEQPVVEPVRPRRASRREQVVAEAPEEFVDMTIATDAKDDVDFIRLHASDEIAPGGHPFGVNGRFFPMRAEVWYKVPSWLLSTIDNCIVDRPQKDEFDRLIGTRQMKRFPYEIFRG